MYEGNIVFVYDASPEGRQSARWLAKWPIAVLSRHGYFVDSMSFFDILEPSKAQKRALQQADIIFYERHVDDPWSEFFEWATTHKRFYLMLDDAYWDADPTENTHRFWSANNRLEKLHDVASRARGVIVPSRALARHFDNGIFKPNRPDFNDPCWTISPLFDDRVVFWGGTSGHVAGMREHPCLEAIRKLVLEDRVSFVSVPGSPELKSIIEQNVPSCSMADFLPYAEWLKVLSGATVSICPIGSEYDEHRSWIKALESAAAGTVWVASDRGVYTDCLGGMEIEDTVESWYEALKWLIFDKEARMELREDSLNWAWKQGLDDHLDEWEAIFNDI